MESDVILPVKFPNGAVVQAGINLRPGIKEGLYIKDLRILKNRDLRDVLIVDNAAYSFGFQLENGIPVLPFYKDKSDTELRNLTNYLLILKDVQDIREINSEVFKMNRYCEFNDPYELIKSLYTDYIKA